MPSQQNDTHYNMNHENRGIALIFNHESFDFNVETRYGTREDATSMELMLKELKFDVTKHDDCTLKSLKKHVNNAAKFDHTHYDCFVMVVLSHGDENDVLYAMDTIYRLETLWLPFTACDCPTLAGKPKLFFIQACRGTQFMPAATIGKNRMDAPYNNSSYKIPAHADFLFAFASVPGYVALRNTDTGSWFIQALCKEFRNNAFEYDMLTLLTFVIRSVAVNNEHQYRTEELKNTIQKQIPCVTTSLTRLLKFNKKRDWFPESKNAKSDIMKKAGLVASLYFSLIGRIPIILEALFYILKKSIIFFFSIIYNCTFYIARLLRSPVYLFLFSYIIYCIIMISVLISISYLLMQRLHFIIISIISIF